MTTQDRITAYFQADSPFWVEVYRQRDVFALIHQLRQAIALTWVDRLALPPGATVLEVGCGAGLAAVALARRGLTVEATDPAESMTRLALDHAAEAGVLDRVQVSQADVHHLDFSDRTFTLVLALGVLPWLHSPGSGLAEMSRVLMPGGYLIANVDNRLRLNHLLDPSLNPGLAPLRAGLRRALGRPTDASPGTTMHTRRQFDRLLRARGLEKLDGRTFGFGPFSFMGRRLADRIGIRLHGRLQGLAEGRVPVVKDLGAQYIVLARRRLE